MKGVLSKILLSKVFCHKYRYTAKFSDNISVVCQKKCKYVLINDIETSSLKTDMLFYLIHHVETSRVR